MMRNSILAVATAFMFAAGPAMAGDTGKDASPDAGVEGKSSTTELRRSLLTFDPSKDVSIRQLVRPAGWVSPPHHHTGQVFLLVTEGAGEMELGDNILTGGPGTIMEAQPGEVMIMKNASDSEPLSFLLVQIGPTGEPNFVLKK